MGLALLQSPPNPNPITTMKKIQRLAEKLGAKFTADTPGDPVFYIDAPKGFKFAATRETSLVYGLEYDRKEAIEDAINDLKAGLIPV